MIAGDLTKFPYADRDARSFDDGSPRAPQLVCARAQASRGAHHSGHAAVPVTFAPSHADGCGICAARFGAACERLNSDQINAMAIGILLGTADLVDSQADILIERQRGTERHG